MRRCLLLLCVASSLAFAATSASAQQLRRPADPLPTPAPALRPIDATPTGNSVLQPPPPVRGLTDDANRPVSPMPALSPRARCLQTARQSIQAPSDYRIAAAQRQLAATDVQRAARNADATDPTDRSGLRAQRNAQQRAIVRERNAARQQLTVAQNNCIGG
ncbi:MULTISPECIES: hypothetical protein [Luteimonas]|uniref:hypothetical protein n=1 Tax=Luteimonas TaxID=83614 RepID=UPI0011813E27|nr:MULTISPECIES: hypothetical protein [Luteimonas]